MGTGNQAQVSIPQDIVLRRHRPRAGGCTLADARRDSVPPFCSPGSSGAGPPDGRDPKHAPYLGEYWGFVLPGSTHR